MSSTVVRQAVAAVAEKIRNGEIANISQEVIEAGGGAEAYVQAAVEAAHRKDLAALERNARDASATGASSQLAFDVPGLEHASVPFWIKIKDPETKDQYGVPPAVASLDQMDAEVRKLEQVNNVRVKVVGGYRATIDRLRELGVPGDTTGAQIAAMFPKELEA